jgi:hypothetical protein
MTTSDRLYAWPRKGKDKLTGVLLHAGALPRENRWETFGLTEGSQDEPKSFKRAMSARAVRSSKRDAWDALTAEQRELLLGRPLPNRRHHLAR